MKFTLKDYQDDAVKHVLDRLKKSRRRWHEDQEKNAFSLTAATGAGKTVMAASVSFRRSRIISKMRLRSSQNSGCQSIAWRSKG